ncbi:hypothetical protein [Paractinoplanes atraurantiacus]|uniref:Uncharacterized protein n=1 Tax=Paractinoplanes atraurantiacus TaxID=1036182 RepID=A0A285JRC4_9ACTN|nr:hypothetical protein [Actinoplanes atraurantiacus]SNY62808.1 hypothetical protein SAMN05421748_12430 [Actinoplanes atraurantiacus]
MEESTYTQDLLNAIAAATTLAAILAAAGVAVYATYVIIRVCARQATVAIYLTTVLVVGFVIIGLLNR